MILPTVTSLTLTVESGTRSSTSRNCAVTVIGLLPTSGPPGSGSLYGSNEQPPSTSAAATQGDHEP